MMRGTRRDDEAHRNNLCGRSKRGYSNFARKYGTIGRRCGARVTRKLTILGHAAFLALSLRSILVLADVPCTHDHECEEKLRPGSECKQKRGENTDQRYCTNPLASGCLRKILGEKDFPDFRACNSDDDGNSLCSKNGFNYTEVRIAPGNWESTMFLSLILQVVLSELLGVPTTIETGSPDPESHLSFYDVENRFPYPLRAYPFDDLKTANGAPGGDCRAVNQPCAHIMPEVWNGQQTVWKKARTEGYIDPADGNGMVGKISWFVPDFVPKRDKSLASFYGLVGKDNQKKLADTFLRPTTWTEYCTEVAIEKCKVDDGVAARAPNSEEILEGGLGHKYRVPGLYRGHFRFTPENNCTANPNCTGHFVDAPCTWSTNFQQQAYWNKIALKSNGPLYPNGGYSYGDMIDIWTAANDTKSAVMMWWWRPDPTLQQWRGTDSAFQPISLPEPTKQCQDARVSSEERCSSDVWVRRSDKEGACDDEAHALRRIIAESLGRHTYEQTPALRSPAYETLKALRVSDLDIDTMLRSWLQIGVDTYGYDPREVVCKWVVDHLDDIRSSIPKGYPRVLVDSNWYNMHPLFYFAIGLGIFVTLSVLATFIMTYRFRSNQVIVYAQIHFLIIILTGFLLASIASIIYPLDPSNVICTMNHWLQTMGYTLGLLPLLVKVAAINKMTLGARKLRRVQVDRNKLLGAVALVATITAVYLVIWTVVDPVTRNEDLTLEEERGNLVAVRVNCSSSSDVWIIAALSWELLLLVCATVLSFQARNVRQEFNESQSLANLVYSHFLFMVLRAITYLLLYSKVITANIQSSVTSLLLSFDTLFAMIIYFGPKFLRIKQKKDHVRMSIYYPAQRRASNGSDCCLNCSAPFPDCTCSNMHSGSSHERKFPALHSENDTTVPYSRDRYATAGKQVKFLQESDLLQDRGKSVSHDNDQREKNHYFLNGKEKAANESYGEEDTGSDLHQQDEQVHDSPLAAKMVIPESNGNLDSDHSASSLSRHDALDHNQNEIHKVRTNSNAIVQAFLP